MNQPSYEVKELLDVKSISACFASILLSALPQGNSWLSDLTAGLTAVALLSTIAYNSIRFFKEVFDRKNNTK